MERINEKTNEKSRSRVYHSSANSSSSSLNGEESFSQRHPRFPPLYELTVDDTAEGQNVGTNLQYDSSLNLLTPAEHARRWKGVVRDWMQEILCLIICVLSLLGVLLVLALSKDSPQPRLPFAISLNTVVSYLGVIYKATLLGAIASCVGQLKWCWFKNTRHGLQDFDVIDAVSRSPLSAFTIFFTFRPYGWIYVGALAILLTAFIDPFLQQTISVPLVPVLHDTASVPRAQGYDAGADIFDLDDSYQGQLDFGLKAAMYQGLFAPQDSSDIKKNCPSGNCTFPIFDSLAFCSKCTNLTGSIRTNDNPIHDDTDGTNQANYTFNLPFVNPITINTLTTGSGTVGVGPALVSIPFPSNLSEAALGVANPLVAFSMLHWGLLDASTFQDQKGNYSTQLPEAFQCALYFCLNTFQVNVTSGVSTSDVVSTYIPPEGTPYGNDTTTSVQLFGNVTDLVFARPSSSQVTSGNDTFYVANSTVGILGNYLTHFFYGYQSIRGGDPDLVGNFDLAANPEDALGYDASALPFLNDTMSVFSSDTWVDVPAIMSGMATTMTNHIRLAGTGQLQRDSFIGGSSHTLVPLIRVDWRWITLPAALVVFGIVFLIYTVIISVRLGVPVWKDGALAMLFHGLDENTSRSLAVAQHGGGRSLNGREMKTMAKRTSVVLETRINGEMKLVQ